VTDVGTILSSEGVHRLGWALVHSTWQLALLAVVLATVLAALRGRSANLRYLIACAGVAVMPLLPVVTYAVAPGRVGPESRAAIASPGSLPAAAMLTGLSPSELTAVVAHELAHVRRHDYLVNLLQTMVETLLFYHPAVWWLSRRVRIEREHCCDDLAAAVCGSRIEYAAALAAVERARSAPALAMAVVGSRRAGPTLQRVRRLLGVSAGEPAGPRAWLGGVLTSVLVLTLGAAAALPLPLPEGSVEGTPRELPGDSAADPATEAATPANSAGISEPVPFLPFPEGESEMRRFHQSMFLVPAAVVLMAGSAESQMGGAGGFGGGGGGGYVSGGGPGSILRLITYPEVQRELRLEDQQKQRIEQVLGNLQAQERKLLEEPRDLPGPERGRAMDERMKRLEKENDKARKEIVGILTSDQAARLNQVSLQNRGAEMLFDREIVKALGITKAQQNRLEAMRREVQEKERDLMMKIPSLPPEKRGEAIPPAIRKIGQIQDEVAQRMLEDVLTARQKGKLKDLQGEKLELAPRYVPRGGGGSGGFGGSSAGGSGGGSGAGKGASGASFGGSRFGTSRSFRSSSEASGEARAAERSPR